MRFTCFHCGCVHILPISKEKFFPCPCGEKIDLEELRSFEEIIEDIQDQEQFDEIQKSADDISAKIVSGEYSRVDFEIAKEKLRQRCEEYFPQKMYLFDMIYESRFKRLWEQFRNESEQES